MNGENNENFFWAFKEVNNNWALHMGRALGNFVLGWMLKMGFKAKGLSMEHGSFEDQSKATFSLTDEDHTLANALRFSLNQDPRVTFCGYSIPHPSDARVNIRVQTTGDPAREVLNDSCQDLMLICENVRDTFNKATSKFKTEKGLSSMDIKN
ncbi:putative mannan endo-1,4-beta-mannosidase 6-like [Capsicum annuum]|nr:putative mannan endo-1,4-beta-mannosidase 6-like [Capsicum annuum]